MISSLAAVLALAPIADPSDWPWWRGPDRDGVSKETAWADEGETLWVRRVGLGYSSASVAGGLVYTRGFDEASGRDVVYALDVENGESVWTFEHPAEIYDNEHGGGTLTTPTVAGEHLFVTSRVGELFCLDAQSGEEVWAVDLAGEVGAHPGRYGFGGSPFLLGDVVIVNVDRIAAVDASTGEVRWTSEPCEARYSTPTLFALAGEPRLAVFGGEALMLVDPAGGEILQSHPWDMGGRGVNASTPIAVGERVFVSSAYNRGGALVEFGEGGPRAVWHNRRMRNKMAGCVLVGGHLYGFDESMLKCLDLEGGERWRKRGLGNGALVAAGDRLILTTSRGELVIASASPEEYRELSSAKLFDDGTFWSPPSIADGRIFVRSSLGELVCRDHRVRGAAAGPVAGEPAPDEAPTPAALFSGHLEAIGGAEALRAVRSIHYEGAFDAKAVGVRAAAAEVQRVAPNLVRKRFKLPSGIPGHFTRVFDGEVGYELDPYRGDKLLEEELQREYRSQGGLHAAASWERDYASLGPARLVEFAERPCWRVDAVTAAGSERSLFFSVETGLLTGRDAPGESMVVLDRYRRFGALLLPTVEKVYVQDTGIEETWTFESVTFDAVDEALFERPEVVDELLREREEGE